MTYLGTVKNGVVIIEGGPAIADGTPVRIETIRPAGTTADPGEEPTIWHKLLELSGAAEGLPADLPERHDDYRRRRLNP